jgi:hypothetical protein
MTHGVVPKGTIPFHVSPAFQCSRCFGELQRYSRGNETSEYVCAVHGIVRVFVGRLS